MGIYFKHRAGKDVAAPGFYLHLEPGEVFVGAGLWQPDTKTATAIRESIVERPAIWKKAVRTAPFTKTYRLSEESMVRAPRGFDPAHPLVDDLRRKHFVGIAILDEKTAMADRFLATFLNTCRTGGPLVRFLCEAVGARY